MTYSKPEIVVLASAGDAIQSNLTKGPVMGDSQNQGTFTDPSAYEADE